MVTVESPCLSDECISSIPVHEMVFLRKFIYAVEMVGASFRPIYRYLFDDLEDTVFHDFFRAIKSQCIFSFLDITARTDFIETRRLTPNSLRIEFDIHPVCTQLKKCKAENDPS